MAAYQVIEEKGNPKYVVLPFGDREAVEDYLDEIWAQKAVKAFKSRKDTRFYALEDVEREILGKKPRQRKAEVSNV